MRIVRASLGEQEVRVRARLQQRKEVLLTHGQPVLGSSAEMHPPSPPHPSEDKQRGLAGRVSDRWSPALVGATEFGTRVATRWTRSSLSEGSQLSGGDR